MPFVVFLFFQRNLKGMCTTIDLIFDQLLQKPLQNAASFCIYFLYLCSRFLLGLLYGGCLKNVNGIILTMSCEKASADI